MFFYGISLSSTLTRENSRMKNQECKIRPQIVNINSKEFFFPLALKKINAAVVATISIIHMQNCVFPMLLKIWTLKYLI